MLLSDSCSNTMVLLMHGAHGCCSWNHTGLMSGRSPQVSGAGVGDQWGMEEVVHGQTGGL